MNDLNGRQKVRFGDVVRNVNTTVSDPLRDGLERTVGLDDLDSNSLGLKRSGDLSAGKTFTRRFLPGQVLFGKRRAYQRKVAVPDFEGVCSGDILVFEAVLDRLQPELLPFIAQSDSFFDHALRTSRGSLSPRTSWNDLAQYEFELAPLEEQPRIAELLWAIEICRSRYQALIEALEVARTAFFDEVAQGASSRLGDALSGITAGRSPAASADPAGAGEFGVLKVSAVGATGFRASENKRILDRQLFEASWEVHKGDLLVTRANAHPTGVGRACLVEATPPGLMLSDKTWRLEIDPKVASPRFLLASLWSRPYRRYIEASASGTEAHNISQAKLAAAPLWLPDMKTQDEVVTQLDGFDSAVRGAQASQRATTALLRSATNELLKQ